MGFGQVVQILWQFKILRFWRFSAVTAKTAAAQAVIFEFLEFFFEIHV